MNKYQDLIYQIFFAEMHKETSSLVRDNLIEYDQNGEYNAKLKFQKDKRSWTLDELDFLLKTEYPPDDYEGGYYKHRIAAFDSNFQFVGSFRYDLFSDKPLKEFLK